MVAELESDLIDLQMKIEEFDWRAKRRAAWPKEWRKIDELLPDTRAFLLRSRFQVRQDPASSGKASKTP